MKFFHRTTYEEALAAKDLAYELASKVAQTLGIGIGSSIFGHYIKINVHGSPRPGLPRKVNGVRIVYHYFEKGIHLEPVPKNHHGGGH